MKAVFLVSALAVGLGGCGGEVQTVPPMKISEAQKLSESLKPEEKTGDAEAYGKLLALVDAIPKEVMEAVGTKHSERVAGQKANLVATGMEFETAVRELVEGEPWVMPTSIKEGMSYEERYEADNGGFPEISKLIAATKLLDAYAEAVEEGGNPELGARAYATSRLLAKRTVEMGTYTVLQLVGIADNAITDRGIREMAIRDVWSAEEIQLMQGQGRSKNGALAGYIHSVKWEWYHRTVSMIAEIQFPISETGANLFDGVDEEILKAIESNPKAFDREATLELCQRLLALQIEDLEALRSEMTKSDAAYEEVFGSMPMEDSGKSEWLEWAKSTSNGFGKLVITNLALPYARVALEAVLKDEAVRGLTEVVLAARRGFAEKGALPSSYAELKKFGLPDDVADPYTGGAFGYDPVRGVAWSSGPDGKDDGGVDEPEVWTDRAKDNVVRLK